MAYVWLINGIPGSGKTSTARALAARLPRAAHIEGDRLQDSIISGSVPPGGLPREEEERQIHLNVHNQCLLADSFSREDITPVIDYVIINPDRLEEYRKHLPKLILNLVTLSPGIPTALERDLQRPDKTVAQMWTHLDEIMRRELNGVGLWLDNSTFTIEETVDYILNHQEEARI